MTELRASDEHRDEPTLEDHPGLDSDEATEAGKMMTASGSTGPQGEGEGGHGIESDKPTLEDHPGLDSDEATDAGKMMTASGSTGPEADEMAEPAKEASKDAR